MESKKRKNRPMPFDEMSTTGAMTRVTDVPRSYRPKARPEGLRERAEQRRMQELEERGMRSQERESKDFEDFGSGHQGRPAKKFKDGGKVNGFPDLNKDGKITKADILKGRGVEGFADGGMVRGVKPGQTSGTKFSGTF